VVILSVNPIDMQSRVEADAKYYKLPYHVLIGRGSEVISDYQIVKLPRLLIVGKDGKIAFTERYATFERLQQELAELRSN
jgi:hypothetical protein